MDEERRRMSRSHGGRRMATNANIQEIPTRHRVRAGDPEIVDNEHVVPVPAHHPSALWLTLKALYNLVRLSFTFPRKTLVATKDGNFVPEGELQELHS